MTVFWLVVVVFFFFVEFFKFTVISKTPNRPRQQHFFPLAGIRIDAQVLNNAESVVAVVYIKTSDLIALKFNLLYAAIQSDDGLPPCESRLFTFNLRRTQGFEGIAARFACVILAGKVLQENLAARTVGVGGNRSGIHLRLTILPSSEPQRGGSQCRRKVFFVGIGVRFIDAAVCFDFRQFEFDADFSLIFNRPTNRQTYQAPLIKIFRQLDVRFQHTQIKFTALRDIFDLFFIQQVQLGVQIKGDGVVCVLMAIITLIMVIVCTINEVSVFVWALRTIALRHILAKRRYQTIVSLLFDEAIAAQIERHAQPRIILQFVNGRTVAAFVFVYIQPAVCLSFQPLITKGKLGFIAKFRTAAAAAACDTLVAVAYQPRVGRINPINGIAALGQPIGIKTGNLAVGRQVGRRAENGSTVFFRNKIIGIIECDISVAFDSISTRKGKFTIPVFGPQLPFFI